MTYATITDAQLEPNAPITSELMTQLRDNAAASYDTALGGAGSGQTWQDVSGSRANNTAYQNTTGRPIVVLVALFNDATFQVSEDNVTYLTISTAGTSGLGDRFSLSVIIPDLYYYRVSAYLNEWTELR